MKNNIYFLIRSLLISLLFFLLLPFHSFAQSLYCPGEPDCSGHGSCKTETITICDCDSGWSDRDCSVPCPNNNCSGHGTCNSYHRGCFCESEWGGSDCSINLSNSCRNNCSNRGTCNSDGSCSCDQGYSGSDCSISCPTNCLVHGFCDGAGGCICDQGYSGSDCSVTTSSTPTIITCPDNCSGNGYCNTRSGNCYCYKGWSSRNCSTPYICEVECSLVHGSCNSDGSCHCKRGWTGFNCSVPSNLCPNLCGVGFCNSNLRGCDCNVGWSGSDCSAPSSTTAPTSATSTMVSCPNDCLNHGFCTKYGCICDPGYSGIDCSISCPNKCSGHGICIDGACSCDPEWSGSNDCSVHSSDERTIQIIEDTMREIAFLDIETLQNITAGDYSAALPAINQAIKSLIHVRDVVTNSNKFTIDSESKLERLLESSINNLKKAYSYIEDIVNDPKARLSRLLKEAEKKIMRSLFTGKKAEDAVSELILGDGDSP